MPLNPCQSVDSHGDAENCRQRFILLQRWTRRLLAGMVLLSLILPFLEDYRGWELLAARWYELLALAAVLVSSALLAGSRWWKQPMPRCDLIAWFALTSTLISLFMQRAMLSTIAWGLMLGLRLFVPSLLIFVIGGLPLLLVQIQVRRRQRRPLPAWGRWWFSAALILISGEFASRLLLASWNQPEQIAFPEQLPEPPDGELHLAAIGGSTTMGWPYHPYYSIVQVTAWQLQQSFAAGDRQGGCGTWQPEDCHP